jgi:hypothetical protein
MATRPKKTLKKTGPTARPTRKTSSAVPPPRIARVAKGRRPQYFSDPAIDKLLWITVTLMEELSVTRERLDTVERLLDRKRVVARRDIENFSGSPAEEAERTVERNAYVDRVMRVLQTEIEEMGGRTGARFEEEAVAAVAS